MSAPPLGPPQAISPQGWGARVNYDAWRDFFTPDDGVAFHHGGGGDYPAHRKPYSVAKEMAQLRAWEWYHLSKLWRGLAYGWGIGMTGTIYRIRGWNRYGAHLGDIDGDGIANNDEIIPVILINSGNHVSPSPEMIRSWENILRPFLEVYSGRELYLYGHKEVQNVPGKDTTCPGPGNMTYVMSHRWSYDMDTRRVFGSNRFGTAAAISQEAFPDPAVVRKVYVATGYDFADSTAGSSLTKDGPLLYTTQQFLPPETRDEIVRCDPDEVVILGGKNAVSDAVEAEINGL